MSGCSIAFASRLHVRRSDLRTAHGPHCMSLVDADVVEVRFGRALERSNRSGVTMWVLRVHDVCVEMELHELGGYEFGGDLLDRLTEG